MQRPYPDEDNHPPKRNGFDPLTIFVATIILFTAAYFGMHVILWIGRTN